MWCLKYLLNTSCEVKCRVSAICCMVRFVDLSRAFASSSKCLSIHSLAVQSVVDFIVVVRCLGVTQSLFA